MAISQTKIREALLQLIYSYEVTEQSIEGQIPLIMRTLMISKKNAYVALEKVKKILLKKESFDELIDRASKDYSAERISKIDKNILRLSLYEYLEEGLDIAVVISEALKLANKFSTPGAGKFIHATLDSAKELTIHV